MSTSPSTDLIKAGACQGSHWNTSFCTGLTWPGKCPTGKARIEPRSAALKASEKVDLWGTKLLLSCQQPYPSWGDHPQIFRRRGPVCAHISFHLRDCPDVYTSECQLLRMHSTQSQNVTTYRMAHRRRAHHLDDPRVLPGEWRRRWLGVMLVVMDFLLLCLLFHLHFRLLLLQSPARTVGISVLVKLWRPTPLGHGTGSHSDVGYGAC